jgi:predicted nucleotidyltransferase
MTKYIYAFGSICRGEIDAFSDVDLLVINDDLIVNDYVANTFSQYREETIRNLWEEGNPFAWHLYHESKLIFSFNSFDLFRQLGQPNPYKDIKSDFENLIGIFKDAKESLQKDASSAIYDLSIVFLVVRNIATCYELAIKKRFNFSRDSAMNMKEHKLELNYDDYQTIKACRILSTRGKGIEPTDEELNRAVNCIIQIEKWISELRNKIDYESI